MFRILENTGAASAAATAAAAASQQLGAARDAWLCNAAKMLVCFLYLSYARYMSRRAEAAGEDVPESVAAGWRVVGQQQQQQHSSRQW